MIVRIIFGLSNFLHRFQPSNWRWCLCSDSYCLWMFMCDYSSQQCYVKDVFYFKIGLGRNRVKHTHTISYTVWKTASISKQVQSLCCPSTISRRSRQLVTRFGEMLYSEYFESFESLAFQKTDFPCHSALKHLPSKLQSSNFCTFYSPLLLSAQFHLFVVRK